MILHAVKAFDKLTFHDIKLEGMDFNINVYPPTRIFKAKKLKAFLLRVGTKTRILTLVTSILCRTGSPGQRNYAREGRHMKWKGRSYAGFFAYDILYIENPEDITRLLD